MAATQHTHRMAKGLTSSELRPAPNGMHTHVGLTPALNTKDHTHDDIVTGETSGRPLDRTLRVES